MGICLRRRELITLLGGAAAWPLAAGAQQGNRVRRIGVLMSLDENDPAAKTLVSALTQALAGLGIVAPVNSDAEIETAIIALGREPGGGLVVMPDAFTVEHRASIISAAGRNNVLAVYPVSQHVKDGGLLSYGVDQVDIYRRAATYVDRILRGAKPGDLPVQLPTKFEMVVNRKTAKALGLEVPPSIILRADEVIE
jgi:putative tryptophan/tyrosine transport system substrate-binding protein